MAAEAKKKRIVVVGGDAAGMSAASQVKRQRPDWEVVVLEQGDYVSYAACGMPYYVEGRIAELDELVEITPRAFREKRGIDLRLRHRAVAVDPGRRTVTCELAAGGREEIGYDDLLLATGARPLVPDQVTPGKRVLTINNLAEAQRVRQQATAAGVRRVAVIGGGLIGLEMSEAFATLGLATTLVHRREHLARLLAPAISSLVKEELQRQGVELCFGAALEGIESRADGVTVLAGGRRLEVDLVLLALGVVPNSELAAAAGLELGVRGAIVVDDHLRTSDPHIYAAGDCAQGRMLVDGRPIFTPLALKANREGMTAGLVMAGLEASCPGTLGTAIAKVFDLGIARTGLTLEEAAAAGFQPVQNLITTRSRARYYPGGGPVHVLVVADRRDGRVLGAQLAGPLDAVKRIDTFAVIIQQGLTLDQVLELDLAYAPPFSPVWDPVLLAARVTRKQL
ncbi:MAG: FAD-dependent oxidoreductase [Deltaproteobacteria bacterium]|nr:FAD-dependent oxidoreductase [Deltaproteobacteria bacterium]